MFVVVVFLYAVFPAGPCCCVNEVFITPHSPRPPPIDFAFLGLVRVLACVWPGCFLLVYHSVRVLVFASMFVCLVVVFFTDAFLAGMFVFL